MFRLLLKIFAHFCASCNVSIFPEGVSSAGSITASCPDLLILSSITDRASIASLALKILRVATISPNVSFCLYAIDLIFMIELD